MELADIAVLATVGYLPWEFESPHRQRRLLVGKYIIAHHATPFVNTNERRIAPW